MAENVHLLGPPLQTGVATILKLGLEEGGESIN